MISIPADKFQATLDLTVGYIREDNTFNRYRQEIDKLLGVITYEYAIRLGDGDNFNELFLLDVAVANKLLEVIKVPPLQLKNDSSLTDFDFRRAIGLKNALSAGKYDKKIRRNL